jgi:hypothetical protein
MDDILALRSSSRRIFRPLPSLDSLDSLSEIRRHGPEPGEQQTAIDEFNFANGGDTRHSEISYAPPPIVREDMVVPPTPQVGTTSSRSRHTSLPPPIMVGLVARPAVLDGKESKKDRKGNWKMEGEVEMKSGGKWAKFWKGKEGQGCGGER